MCGVGACTRLLPTQSEPRETSAPQIDRIPSARPSWRDRQYRELKKIFFSPPSKCPIDLFGPVSNRTILKRLHGASRSSSRNPRRRSATPRLSWRPDPISNLPGPISNLQSASRRDPQSPMSNARPGLSAITAPDLTRRILNPQCCLKLCEN